MRRKGQGSASISAVVVFLSALLAIGLMATILPPVANVLSGFREGLRERGERGSELIRIYIHSANETELEPPIITIINGWDRESILTDYVVVARDGRILAAGKMGGSLGGIRIPAGARIDLTPADFGLSYGTFAAMADEVKAIYIRTAEGNSFGSSYGPPPKINPDYQLSITQRSQHIIVIGSTVTSYNFTILGNLTLPTMGYAKVVKNAILVDSSGLVRGGVTAGWKWSDGSFNPDKIPDYVAFLTRITEIVPIGGYYYVQPFPWGCFSVYSSYDTCPNYIEMIEFYPVEYYTPGSPVERVAYWFRYNEKFPIKLQYPARVDGEISEIITTVRTTATWTSITTFSGVVDLLIYSPTGQTYTATATIPVIIRDQIRRAVIGYITTITTTTTRTITVPFITTITSTIVSTKTSNVYQDLSGDSYIHHGGSVGERQIIKIKAPIVLLNYIYGITASLPRPSPGGGKDGYDTPMICDVDESTLNIPSSENIPSSDPNSASSDTPLQSPSGPVDNFSVRTVTITAVRHVVCRPVTLAKPY
jgi:hypothetical protein